MIKGNDCDKELFTCVNRTVFDLSGSAAEECVLYHKNVEVLIHKVWVQYIEATSSDAGIKLSIGSPADDDAYWLDTSDVSKSAYDTVEYLTGDMTLAKVPANTPIIIKSAGSKSGAGTCYIGFAYTLNN